MHACTERNFVSSREDRNTRTDQTITRGMAKGFFKKFSCPPIKGNRNTLKLVLQIETVFILEFLIDF